VTPQHPTATPDHHDWAPYLDLDQAAGAYLRDPDVALEALRSVMDPSAIRAFVMERTREEQDSAEVLYQEVALTDGYTLWLWMGHDIPAEELPAEDGEPGPGAGLFTSTLRWIPLSAIIDSSLKTSYRVADTGGRTLHSVELRLTTTQPDHTIAETTSRTEIYGDELEFTKSVTDGGRAQMQRLAQFGRVVAAGG
jgi:hypothetical protein